MKDQNRERLTIVGGNIDISDKEWESVLMGDGTESSDLTAEEFKMVKQVALETKLNRALLRRHANMLKRLALSQIKTYLDSGQELSLESARDIGYRLGREMAEKIKELENKDQEVSEDDEQSWATITTTSTKTN